MSKRYTDSQNKVLDFDGGNLLVSASAGSGKTEVSMEYLYRLISSGKADVDEVIVVTFTVAAANELKDRLAKKLKEGTINSRTIDSINKIPTSDIGTLHSLCQKTIKRYFYKIGVDPSFELISEGDNAVLRNECLDKIIIDRDGDADFDELLKLFKSRKDTKNFKESMLDVYDFMSSISSNDFLDNRALAGYDLDLDNNIACTYLIDYYKGLFMSYRDKLLEIKGMAAAVACDKLISFCDGIVDRLDSFSLKMNFEEFYDAVSKLDNLPNMPIVKSNQDIEPIKNQLKAIWSSFKSAKLKCNKIFDCEPGLLKNRLALAGRYAKVFVDCIREFDRVYTERKRTLGLMDFNDLEKYMLELCLDQEVLDYFARYKRVIVDEYQDINSVQEKIIQAISHDNLIMVGDIKQSIYGFRNSTPEIFLSKYDKYNSNSSAGVALSLNDNFRSNPKILGFVNRIFDRIMTPMTAGISYSETSRFNIRSCDEQLDKIEIDIVEKVKEDVQDPDHMYDLSSGDSEEVDYAKAEARIVARHIADLYGKEIYDISSQSMKRLDYASMCILSRKRGDYYKAFVDELARLKVPIVVQYSDKLLQNIDVQILLNFLKCIGSNNDDIAYTGLITSYFVGATNDDLVKISEMKGTSYITKAIEYACKYDDILSHRINSLNQTISKYRLRATFADVYTLLSDICEEWKVFDYLMSLSDGERRCMLVTRYIESFLGSEYNASLVRYLYYVDSYAGDAKTSLSLSSSGNSVLVDTIHGSKGLGYSVVFLVGAGEDLSLTLSARREVARDKYFGIGLSALDVGENSKTSSIVKEAIKLSCTRADVAEELRLLYVALTRAKSKLIIVGKAEITKFDPIMNDYDVITKSTTLGLVAGAMGAPAIQGIQDYRRYEDDDVVIQVYDPREVMSDEKLNVEFDDKPSDPIKALEIDGYLDKPYEYRGAENITLKNSVSSLMQQVGPYECYNPTPNKLTLHENVTNREDSSHIGTAYHKIMQEISFDATIEEVQSLIDSYASQDKVYAHVSPSKIFTAIKTLRGLNVDRMYREKKFLAYLPYSDIVESSDVADRVLVQGVIDLVLIGDKNILIDYKTSVVKSVAELKKKYALQLKIYKMATERALKIKIDSVYIYSFVLDKLVSIS